MSHGPLTFLIRYRKYTMRFRDLLPLELLFLRGRSFRSRGRNEKKELRLPWRQNRPQKIIITNKKKPIIYSFHFDLHSHSHLLFFQSFQFIFMSYINFLIERGCVLTMETRKHVYARNMILTTNSSCICFFLFYCCFSILCCPCFTVCFLQLQ